MNLMEGIIPEYSRKGLIRGPSGSSVTGIVPTNAYPTSEPSTFVVIGGNGESIYERLMNSIGRPDLTGPNYAGNHRRVLRQAEIEEAIAAWCKDRTAKEICRVMDEARVPRGKVMNVKDLMETDHIKERGMIEKVRVPFKSVEGGPDEGWELDVHRVTPLLECETPTTCARPAPGQHNEEVLSGLLGLSASEMNDLTARGVTGKAHEGIRY